MSCAAMSRSRYRGAQELSAFAIKVWRCTDSGRSMDDARVLPRREVWLIPKTAREQILALASAHGGQPLVDSASGFAG
jgi:hypothetical protein